MFAIAVIWLGACALVDRRTGLIPNRLTLPVIAGGTAFTLIEAIGNHSYDPLLAMLGLWVLFTVPWLLDVYGGGDQKLLMGLSSLCPSIETAIWVSVGMIGSWLVWIAYRLYGEKLRSAGLPGGQKGRWRATWTLVPGGIIAIVQRLRLLL